MDLGTEKLRQGLHVIEESASRLEGLQIDLLGLNRFVVLKVPDRFHRLN